MRKIGLLIFIAFAFALSVSAAFAQCYPGLGDCSQGQRTVPQTPQQPPQTAAPEYYYVGPVNPPDPWLALRSEPSSSAGYQILQMPEGTLFAVLATRGKWFKVQLLDGRVGWAHSNWIKCCRSQ